jgi:hypothetical protein
MAHAPVKALTEFRPLSGFPYLKPTRLEGALGLGSRYPVAAQALLLRNLEWTVTSACMCRIGNQVM